MHTKRAIFISAIVLALILIFAFVRMSKAPTIVSPQVQSNVTYYCSEGIIQASFGSSSVSLILPDNRALSLNQATSGSGIRYELGSTTFLGKGANAFVTEGEKTIYTNCIAGVETSVSNSEVNYTDLPHTFSFNYPSVFNLSGADGSYAQDWRVGTQDLGLLRTVVTIPRSFEPQTNFGEAKFTVGVSANTNAVTTCLIPEYGSMQKVSTTTINGIAYTKLVSTDAGAGNYYETTSYRTVRDNMCYAIEYTIHSSNIYNYSPDQGISAFDHDKVASVLEGMARSFSFF